MSILRLLLAVSAIVVGLGQIPVAIAQVGGVLRVSAIPDEAPTELQRKFKPLGDYLKKATGLEIEFIPVTDYAAVVEGLATNKLDLAWLGGFTYVQARLRTNGGVVPIVQRAEDATFTSRFIVPVNSTAKTLADLKGKTFAFGAPSSTSGSLMPRYYLLKAGIDPERDFKSVAFSGAHDATVAFVASGRAEAGVLNASVMDKLVESHNPNAEKVRVLAVTPPYLRLQLDGAARARSGPDEEDHRRLSRARSDPARDEGDHGSAARLEIHSDLERELRRHRGSGALGRSDQVGRGPEFRFDEP